MQVTITGRHMNLSDDSQEFIKERASRFERYFDRITSVQATVDFQKNEHLKMEFVVQAAHTTIVGTEVAEELHVAVDRAAEKVERKLKKVNDKLKEHRTSKGGNSVQAQEGEGDEEAESYDESYDE